MSNGCILFAPAQSASRISLEAGSSFGQSGRDVSKECTLRRDVQTHFEALGLDSLYEVNVQRPASPVKDLVHGLVRLNA